jgi:flagellar motility protein MotE (MotC chaperone)
MRRTILSSVMATGLTLALAGAAVAAPIAATQSSEKQDLVAARNELATRAAQTKGAPSAEYDQDRRRVDSLIDALENGQRVSPSDVDKALEDAARPSPW